MPRLQIQQYRAFTCRLTFHGVEWEWDYDEVAHVDADRAER